MRSAMALSLATRSASGNADHFGKARRAAAIAASTSWVVPCGQAATTVSSAGLRTSKVVAVGAGLPSMVSVKAVMSFSISGAPLVAKGRAEGAWRPVDTLVDAEEPGQVQVVNAVVAVGQVIHVSREVPMAVAGRVAHMGVGHDVGALVVIRRVDELEILVVVPLTVRLARHLSAQHRPLVMRHRVEAPTGRLGQLRGEQV